MHRPDLSAAFGDCSVAEAACTLHLLYSPQHANTPSFAALAVAGHLAVVALLANKLDAEHVLAGVEACLTGGRSTVQLKVHS